MRARHGLIGALLLLSLAGCGGDGDSAGSAEEPTTASRTTSAPSPSEEPAPEALAAEAATTAVVGMLDVTDAAKGDPAARDWEPEVRRFAADPAALLAVTAVRDYATLGLRQEGETVVDLEVTTVDLSAADGATVRITGCYDSQSTRVVRQETGEVIPPGTSPRFVWDITVVHYDSEPGSPWLVTQLNPLTDQPC